MFLSLLQLYKKYSASSVPLEDYNTECFKGILELYPEIKESFIYDFLKLPEDNYYLKTQLRKELPDTMNCIVDFVLEGDNNICFIENKVESSEGWQQLTRYANVLDIYYPNKNKFLFYCTKYSDEKNQNGEYFQYNFKQFKWYEVAKFLKRFKQNELINNYLQFLNYNGMEQDYTFRAENFLTMQNFRKTIDILEFHINNSKSNFEKKFSKNNTNKNTNWDQLKFHKRLAYFIKNVLGYDSEILYAISLENLELKTQIWLSKANLNYDEFLKIDIKDTQFLKIKNDFGAIIFMKEDLGKFMNKENSDILIKEWFSKSFDEIESLILKNNHLKWTYK